MLGFSGEDHLRRRLVEMLLQQEGLLASQCLVQEWVDFDFESRLYFLPPRNWATDQVLQPVKFEYNCWGERDESKRAGVGHASFHHLDERGCLETWDQDAVALDSAKEQAVATSQILLRWLLSVNSQHVPMIRLDFMFKRTGKGAAHIHFGEFCEVGACCLNWKDGPPTIWRAVIDWIIDDD